MKLEGERTIPASVQQTWDALNDPETLKACIKGCESIEATGENQFLAVMGVRIGPVNAKFKGKLDLVDIVPPDSYKINFEGQGGVAGFGKGSAIVRLSPQGDDTLLKYSAEAQVGGKIAQVGSRLVDSAASKIAEDFFKAFEAHMAALPRDGGGGGAGGTSAPGDSPASATAGSAAPSTTGSSGTPTGSARLRDDAAPVAAAPSDGAAPGARAAGTGVPAAAAPAAATSGASTTTVNSPRSPSKLPWILGLGAIAIALVAYYL
ncbi:MAG: carbon monoxide dehydrogenase subunit G [Burkholderiaceae bacterium]